jgi:hypothetical protein
LQLPILQFPVYIVVVLLLSSGAVRAGSKKVLKQGEFMADIYQQFARDYIFLINCEVQEASENEFYILISCVLH